MAVILRSFLAVLCLITSTAHSLSQPRRFTFNSSGTEIVGYHWKPPCLHRRHGSTFHTHEAPAIVMGHGLAALQTSKLQPYARRFAAEGYHAFTFDYRHWGQSDGQPRNIVNISLQQDDFRAAVKAVKEIEGVNEHRIVIWGTSLSGGTVLSLGPDFYDDPTSGVVGVIAQVPHTNGPATSALTPQNTIPNLVALSINDTEIAGTTETPIYIPVANHSGQLGLLTQAGAYEGYHYIQPTPPGPEYSNIAARFVIELPLFSPNITAAKSHLPTFIGIGLDDNIVSPTAAIDLAQQMPRAMARKYRGCGHFDVYPGKPFYQQNLADQVEFLHTYVPIHGNFGGRKT